MPVAQRALDRLIASDYRRVMDRLTSLQANPRPPGVLKMAGDADLYRLRAGDWRIVYQIQDRELIVLVVKVGNRRDVYR